MTSKIKTLNYTAQCVSDLKTVYKSFFEKQKDEESLAMLSFLTSALEKAIKFIIPNGNNMFETVGYPTASDFDSLHLPYQIILLEYELKNTNNKISNSADYSYDNTKRIALAIEMDSNFIVFSFWFDVVSKLWTPCYTSAIIDKNQINISNDAIIPMSNLVDSKPKNTGLAFTLKTAFPTLANDIKMRVGDNNYIKTAYRDVLDEISAILKFLSVYQCINIKTEIIPIGKKSAFKKRAKLARYEYRILKIDSSFKKKYISQKSEIEEFDKRHSPRLHTRRGHLRLLKSGNRIWVNPCLVGTSSNGIIDKDYLWI